MKKLVQICDQLILDIIFKQEKKMIEECSCKEDYKREKTLLIFITILSSLMPLLISVLGTTINNTFNIISFIKSGEILLIFYSLLAGTTIEAVSLKETNIISVKAIEIFRIICIIMLLSTFGLYAILKFNETNTIFWYTVFTFGITIINLFLSLYICFLGLKFKFLSNLGG